MSGKFYSIYGTKVSNSSDSPQAEDIAAEMKRKGKDYRGPLPDPKESPQFEEFYGDRAATSHDSIGLDPGMKVNYTTPSGEVIGAVVEGEEHDQHSGEVTQYINTSNDIGAGTRKLTWKPDQERTMVLTDDQKGA